MIDISPPLVLRVQSPCRQFTMEKEEALRKQIDESNAENFQMLTQSLASLRAEMNEENAASIHIAVKKALAIAEVSAKTFVY